jgi:Ser/Thr protein kinase RdoA (MazF antagonist)
MSSVLKVLEAHYGIASATVLCEPDGRVTRVSSLRGQLAVKRFTADDVDLANREAGLLAVLAPADPRYRVQSLLQTGDAAPLAFLEDDAAVLVTHWCRGSMKVYTDIAEAEWHALGTELGALHMRLTMFTGSLPRASELVVDLTAEGEKIAGIRGRVASREPTRSAEIGRYLDARLALLDAYGERGATPPPGPEHPIHNDYNQYNYLFDDRLPPIILDWEGAIAAPQAYEVVRCLNHLPLVAPTHATAFVNGYRSVRPLDRDTLRWAVDRCLLEHAIKNWPLEQLLAGASHAEQALAGSMEVLLALHAGVPELERFFGLG